jgi:hypothetical protein
LRCYRHLTGKLLPGFIRSFHYLMDSAFVLSARGVSGFLLRVDEWDSSSTASTSHPTPANNTRLSNISSWCLGVLVSSSVCIALSRRKSPLIERLSFLIDFTALVRFCYPARRSLIQLLQKMSDIDIAEPDLPIDAATCIAFVLNTMKLVDVVTPMLSLKHLHSVSMIVGHSMAVIEQAVRALEASEARPEPPIQWTPADFLENALNGYYATISTPPPSPRLARVHAEEDLISLREFLESMTPDGRFLLSTRNSR